MRFYPGHILSLSPSTTMIKDRFDTHALLPPILTDGLFDLENFGAKTILLNFINKIKSIKTESLTFDKENSVKIEEEEEWKDINNTDPNTEPNPVSEATRTTEEDGENFDELGRPYELKFGKVLKFLWGAIHQEKLVTGVSLDPCSLPSTTGWLNKVHDENLKKKVTENNENFQINFVSPQHSNSVADFQNAAISISRLSNIGEPPRTRIEDQEGERQEER